MMVNEKVEPLAVYCVTSLLTFLKQAELYLHLSTGDCGGSEIDFGWDWK